MSTVTLDFESLSGGVPNGVFTAYSSILCCATQSCWLPRERNSFLEQFSEGKMTQKPERDVEKDYPLPEFIEKLRRLADALENGRRFEIQIAGERISVPVRAICNIEHERGEDEEEIEFQIKWSTKSAE